MGCPLWKEYNIQSQVSFYYCLKKYFGNNSDKTGRHQRLFCSAARQPITVAGYNKGILLAPQNSNEYASLYPLPIKAARLMLCTSFYRCCLSRLSIKSKAQEHAACLLLPHP